MPKFAGKSTVCAAAIAGALALIYAVPANASSHREAPFISSQPKVDGTDLYMFRSYEAGRQDYVTLIVNYIPFTGSVVATSPDDSDPREVESITATSPEDSGPGSLDS